MLQNFKTCALAFVAACFLSACQTPSSSEKSTVASTATGAGLRLPNLFSHNMVLQRDQPVPVWGWGDDGEVVTVTFRGQKVSAKVQNGKWSLKLRSLKAGGPDTLTVTEGSRSIKLTNVLVGDVWVASGQSNMEFKLKTANGGVADAANSSNAMIHLLNVPRHRLDAPTNDVGATWTECNPDTTPEFSAVAYYFATELQKARGVPIGVIESSWGGTPCEAWTRREALESNPRMLPEKSDSAAAEKLYREHLASFKKKQAAAKAKKTPFKDKEPTKPWNPGELYNGMIAPLVPYGIKGAIWYQGENNAANAAKAWRYHEVFPNMIRNWRQDWAEGDFSFLLVQIAPFKPIQHQPGESDWASVREAQLLSTKILPKVGMAVITDVGEENNIHPTKKQPVGARLALAARHITYGEPIEFSGPVYKNMTMAGDKIILHFNHVGGGLQARDGALKGFAICGADKQFVWALAEISGNTIVVSSPSVSKPVAVRFGWADYPVVNLWNKDGLPASPFRTDDFPLTGAQ